MTNTELNELIFNKLGTRTYIDGMMNVLRFHYRGNTYLVTTDLNVEKVDGLGDDTQQLEKLLRGEQWDGTGLPPVGTECEFYKYDPHVIPAYQKGKIQYFSDCTVVIKTDKPGEMIGHPINFDFRPLRTEREKAIEQMMSAPKPCGFAIQGICEQLYDAIVAGKIDGLGKVG